MFPVIMDQHDYKLQFNTNSLLLNTSFKLVIFMTQPFSSFLFDQELWEY